MSFLPLSVVIITKNEAHILGTTLASLAGLSNDVVVADNGSTDATMDIARQYGCRVHQMSWQGYGATKKAAQQLARHPWVLFLDADEALDHTLKAAIEAIDYTKENRVYACTFKNYVGGQHLRFGEMRGFKKIRLYHRQHVCWNESEVHERLDVPAGFAEVLLPGYIQHYSVPNLQVYAVKMTRYAGMMAAEQFRRGKKASWFKLYPYPFLFFLQVYVLKGGFMDGRMGFASACMHTYYTMLKYHRLKELAGQAPLK